MASQEEWQVRSIVENPGNPPVSKVKEWATVNKAFLLKRGWTRTAIKRILGEPDRTLVMRKFRKDRPECLYNRERVLEAEEAGAVRYRKAGERCMPGPHAPEDLAAKLLSAGSARQRRSILKSWAEGQGMMAAGDPPQRRRAQWDIVVSLFIEQ
jgi:hypothetical protein